jgi:hypothetical protein
MPSLIASIGANIAPFISGMQEAKSHAKKSGESIGSALGNELTGKLKGLVALGAIEETVRRTAEYASKVQDLSNRLGISTTAVQEWDYALKQNGSSIDAAVPFFEKLAISRDKALRGNPELIAHYEKLGLSVKQLASMRTNDIGAAISKAYEIGDPQALIESLRAVGGKAAGELSAAFRDGLTDLLDEAPLISPEDIALLDKATDAFGRMKAELISGLAPAIAGVASLFDGLWRGLNTAAGVGMGFVTGVVEKIRSDPSTSLADALSAGKENAAQMFQGSVAEAAAREDADRAKADRLKQGRMHAGSDEDEKPDKKAEREQKIADQQLALQEKEDEREAARAAKEAERSAAQAAKDAQDKMPFKPGEMQVNSLARSGFFVGMGALAAGPEVAALDVQKKSEQHLAEIKKGIVRLTAISRASVDDTQFS